MKRNHVVWLHYLISLFVIWGSSMNVYARITDEDLTVELRIYVDGKKILSRMEIAAIETSDEKERLKLMEKNHINIKKGQSVQLKVEMIEKEGATTDVTSSPYIIYEGYSEELLSVDKKGTIVAISEPPADRISLNSIRIIFHHDDKLGFNGIMVNVID